eukprot:PhM_4_TR1933/c0_g1_i1/m.36128
MSHDDACDDVRPNENHIINIGINTSNINSDNNDDEKESNSLTPNHNDCVNREGLTFPSTHIVTTTTTTQTHRRDPRHRPGAATTDNFALGVLFGVLFFLFALSCPVVALVLRGSSPSKTDKEMVEGVVTRCFITPGYTNGVFVGSSAWLVAVGIILMPLAGTGPKVAAVAFIVVAVWMFTRSVLRQRRYHAVEAKRARALASEPIIATTTS